MKKVLKYNGSDYVTVETDFDELDLDELKVEFKWLVEYYRGAFTMQELINLVMEVQ